MSWLFLERGCHEMMRVPQVGYFGQGGVVRAPQVDYFGQGDVVGYQRKDLLTELLRVRFSYFLAL